MSSPLCAEFRGLLKAYTLARAKDKLAKDGAWLQGGSVISVLLDCHLLMLDSLGPRHCDALLRTMRDPRQHWTAVQNHLLSKVLEEAESACRKDLMQELSAERLLAAFKFASKTAMKGELVAGIHSMCNQGQFNMIGAAYIPCSDHEKHTRQCPSPILEQGHH